MGIIGRVLGSARRGTGTTTPAARTGRTGRKGTPTSNSAGRTGGKIAGLLRRKSL